MQKSVLLFTSFFTIFIFNTFSYAWAQERQLGNIIYSIPNNWEGSRVRRDRTITIRTKRKTSASEKCKNCQLKLHVGSPKDRDGKTWLQNKMAFSLRKRGKVLKNLPARRIKFKIDNKKIPLDIHSRIVKKRGRRLQSYFLVTLPTRLELVSFETSIRNKKKIKQSKILVKTAFKLIQSMKFLSLGAKPLLGKPEPGRLSGVYWGLYLSPTFQLDGSVYYDSRSKIYTFYPNGRFYRGLPPEGVKNFSYDKVMLSHTSEVGNYYQRGSTVNLLFADGQKKQIKYDNKNLKDSSTTLSKVIIPKSGFRFEGRQSSFYYSGFSPGSGIKGGIAATSDFYYYKDGTFFSSKFAASTGNFENGAGQTTGGFALRNKRKKKSGKYHVESGILKLIYSSGKQESRDIFLTRKKKSVFIDGKPLKSLKKSKAR